MSIVLLSPYDLLIPIMGVRCLSLFEINTFNKFMVLIIIDVFYAPSSLIIRIIGGV